MRVRIKGGRIHAHALCTSDRCRGLEPRVRQVGFRRRPFVAAGLQGATAGVLQLDRLVYRCQRRLGLGHDQPYRDDRLTGVPGLPALTTGNFNTSGGLAGGTVGYNYQFNWFLVGAEADLDWSNIRGTFNGAVPIPGGTAGFSLSSQLQWLETTRVRAGFVWDHALIYGTAGAALGGLNATANASAAASGIGAAVTASDTQTRFGWTAGGGVEYAFTNYLSGKVEYMYVDLGSQNQIVIDNVKFKTNIVRAGLNLHF